MNDFFRDLKIIELAGVLAGPSAGYFFAELGASVIKIENPRTGGDVTRTWKQKNEDPKEEGSAYFWSVNALKEFKNLDLTETEGVKQIHELVRDADIVITNYKGNDAEKLQVDFKTLYGINEKIIYASIVGFEEERDRAAYDLILQAESGFMSMNGEPGGKPLKMPVALIDVIAGHQLKEALLIALLRKFKTGKGSNIIVPLFQSAVASLVNQASNWLNAKNLPVASGSLHPNIAPYGELFDTRDKHLITFAIGSNKQFRQLCEMIGYSQLANEPAYVSNQQRVINRRQLYAVLYDYIRKMNSAEILQTCFQMEIPVGKIRNLKEVFEIPDAQKMLYKFRPGGKDITVVSGNAFRFID